MRLQLLFAALAAVLLAAGASAACTPGKGGCEKCDRRTGKCLECGTYGYSDEEEWPAYGLTRNGTCTKCQLSAEMAELCVRCNGDAPSRCIECSRYEVYEQGVYLKRDGTCAPCPDGCDRCRRFNGTCEACMQGYGLVNGKCERCSQEDCIDCSGNKSRCKKCQQFAILDGSSCKRCEDLGIPFCYECKKDRKGQPVCAICGQEGYGLKNGRCVKCLPNCRECSDDATKCTSCSFGDLGGVFMRGKCQRCSVVTKGRCDYCQLRKGKPVCTGCKRGLGLKSGKCVPCKQRSCAMCGDYNNCMECKPGYTLGGASGRGSCHKGTEM